MPGMFICESCTVRCVLQRELRDGRDQHLLGLERMRILDIAHSWAPGSFKSYQPYLRAVGNFQAEWGITILDEPKLPHPPRDRVIPLMWCQEAYSLRPGRRRKGLEPEEPDQVAFATVRQLRSAVAHHEAWTAAVTEPGSHHYDQSRRLIHQSCRITDTGSASLFAKGLASRTGTESKPSKSLLDRHVRKLNERLEDLYQDYHHSHRSDEEIYQICQAGFLNLLLWLAWLRSSEAFGLEWGDVELTLPDESAILDIPEGSGAIQLRLRPETKSNRNVRADVIIAFQSRSDLYPGHWLLRLQNHRTGSRACLTHIFCHVDGTRWDSNYFRTAYLYPSLHAQGAAGDVHLASLYSCHGPSIEDAFWGLASYRNGARSHVSRERTMRLALAYLRLRAATDAEVYEHGRWRMKRNNEDIDKVYQQWTYRDRLAITLECM